MKFIAAWTIKPGFHKPAGESFLKSGAPVPEGMEILGRWHAPGSAKGWVLIQGNDLTAIAAHMAEWGDMLDLDVTPVLEDQEAGAALSRVYGG